VDNRIYVIKQVNINGMKKEERESTIKEVQILASLDHACVVRYYDSFISKTDKKLNIVMEYASKGTLHDIIQERKGKKFPEKLVWQYFIQILYGMNCMLYMFQ
jgi:serine/threonine protein kinase